MTYVVREAASPRGLLMQMDEIIPAPQMCTAVRRFGVSGNNLSIGGTGWSRTSRIESADLVHAPLVIKLIIRL